MNKTNDFKYNLPAYSDPVDIEDLNDNFRGIDDALMAGLCKKDYTGNNMGSSDPSARKYAWAPWFEIVNDNEFDVVVTDRNAPVESEEATINIAAGQTFRKYINGRYYMNFYVQDQHDVTFKWFTNAETYINESGGGGGGTGTVTSVSVQGGSGSHLTGSGNPIETSGTITINVDDGYSIPSDNEQTAWDGKAADLKAEINSSTYVMTLQLKDSAGNLIGTAKTIDLPLETMVVDGEYDSQTQKIKLELKNGNYVEFSVADLVSGLQTELSASNKLDPDYIDYDASHRAVSDTEKNTWNGKQNALTFDDTPTQNSNNPVKSGGIYTALAGKQASLDSTQLAAVNSGIDSTKVGQISTNQTNILYGMQNGVKNVLPFTAQSMTDDNVTFTRNSDGSITVNSNGAISANKNLAYFEGKMSDLVKETGDYVLYGNSSNSRVKMWFYYTDNWSGVFAPDTSETDTYIIHSITKSDRPVIVRVKVESGTALSNVTIYPMICTKAAWDQEPNVYRPFALPNYDLTRLESEDRASLAEVVDSGAKNLVNIPDGTITNVSVATITASNGILTISGTATADAWITLTTIPNLSGTCVLSGIQTTTTENQYFLRVEQGSNAVNDFGNSGTANFNGNGTLYLRIKSGYAFSSGTIIKPMLCTKAAFGVSKAFVPYRVPITGLMSVVDKEVSCSSTLTTTGIKFTATEKAAYRITATAIYYNSIPMKLAIKHKIGSGSTQGTLCTAVHVENEDVSLTVSGIRLLDVGGEFEIFAQYASSTTNRFYVLVEKLG